MGFPCSPVSKETACNAGDLGSIPGWERFPWKRKCQPTPVFLPGESHEQRHFAGYSPWGCKSWTWITLLQGVVYGSAKPFLECLSHLHQPPSHLSFKWGQIWHGSLTWIPHFLHIHFHMGISSNTALVHLFHISICCCRVSNGNRWSISWNK